MNKSYKVFETMHERKTYFLVFDSNNEVVYKGETIADANNFIHTSQRTEKNN